MMFKSNEIAQRLLNSKGKKMIQILDIVKSQNSFVTVKEIENKWDEIAGRTINKTQREGKRVIDNTVRNLMNEMVELDLLKREKNKEKVLYKLSDELNNLNTFLNIENDFSDLIRWSNTFSKYKGLPFFDDLQDLLSDHPNYEEIMNDWTEKRFKPVIEFETTQRVYSGWGKNIHNYDITDQVANLLSFLYRVITLTNQTIAFTYRSFQKQKTQTFNDVEPYFLKEHNRRWYLIAKLPNITNPRVFSLDRIIALKSGYIGRTYLINEDFDSNLFFQHAIGVFIDQENEPQHVSFELKDGPKLKNVEFLISSPIHPSQRSVKSADEWTRFEYFVFVGPELVRSIRQWGVHNVRNIKPEFLNEMVNEF